jgi:hypothetical protein
VPSGQVHGGDWLNPDNADSPSLVPTRLRQNQAMGRIPVRAFFIALGTGLLLTAPVATLGRREFGDAGPWFVMVPLVAAVPFALPWLEPSAEHGLLRAISHLGRRLCRRTISGVPRQPEIAGPWDGRGRRARAQVRAEDAAGRVRHAADTTPAECSKLWRSAWPSTSSGRAEAVIGWPVPLAVLRSWRPQARPDAPSATTFQLH